MAYLGKESKKSLDICICITDSLCCTPETNTTLSINHTPIKNFKKTKNHHRADASGRAHLNRQRRSVAPGRHSNSPATLRRARYAPCTWGGGHPAPLGPLVQQDPHEDLTRLLLIGRICAPSYGHRRCKGASPCLSSPFPPWDPVQTRPTSRRPWPPIWAGPGLPSRQK